MSRESKDRDYKPKRKVVAKRRTPGRSRPQAESIRYRDYESEGSSVVGVTHRQEVDSDIDHFSDSVDHFSDSADPTQVNTYNPFPITKSVEGTLTEFFERCKEFEMAKQAEKVSVDKLLELIMQMRQEDKIREEQREKERLDREDRREERQACLLKQLKEAPPAVPQTVYVNQHKLPTMTDKDDVEIFLRQLEIALRTSKIPVDKWKQHLLSQLTLQAKEQVIGLLEDDDTDYDDIKKALLNRHVMTYAAAAEAFFTADKGELLNIPVQQAGDKLIRWIDKMMEGAETDRNKKERIAMGALRSYMVPELKSYMDLSKPTNKPEFDALTEQWVRSQPFRRSMYKTTGSYRYSSQARDSFGHSSTSSFASGSTKKPVTCYACGKVGHMSRDCRSKPLESHKQTSTSISPAEVKPLVCFSCHEVGHKSPQCPKRNKDRVKKVLIQEDQIAHLANNDVMAIVGGVRIPMTFDTGAQISLVPIELVRPDEFTGETLRFKGVLSKQSWSEGKVATVTMSVGNQLFQSRALALPGEELDWTALLSVNISDREKMSRIIKITEEKENLPEADMHYLPPHVKDGQVQGAVLVSEGEVVEKTEDSVSVNKAVVTNPEPEVPVEHAVGEGNDAVVSEQVLVDGDGIASVDVEAEGVAQEGSADSGIVNVVTVDSIVSDVPRVKLAELTRVDPTLVTARSLADKQAEGYHWEDDLLFRGRLDEWGVNFKQLCLPKQYRPKCLRLSHEKFGHLGRNKMIGHIRKLFYWPSLTSDVANHCKSCDVCQRHAKQSPKVLPMQEREVVTIPSERVCVDLVGPFPTAKGGFKFLLTYVDMATRWPEAVPLRKTTTRVIINQLQAIFCRNGFPTSLVSDNGPQFTSVLFTKFLKTHGIQQIKASPYHP